MGASGRPCSWDTVADQIFFTALDTMLAAHELARLCERLRLSAEASVASLNQVVGVDESGAEHDVEGLDRCLRTRGRPARWPEAPEGAVYTVNRGAEVVDEELETLDGDGGEHAGILRSGGRGRLRNSVRLCPTRLQPSSNRGHNLSAGCWCLSIRLRRVV